MAKSPPSFDIYFSVTKLQNVLCPLCGGKKFTVSHRRNGEFDIECKGRKIYQYNSDFAIMEWKHNFCPWNIRLGRADFVRAAIAKADHAVKIALGARVADKEVLSAKRELAEENNKYRAEQKRAARKARELAAGETRLDGEVRAGGEEEERELGPGDFQELHGATR